MKAHITSVHRVELELPDYYIANDLYYCAVKDDQRLKFYTIGTDIHMEIELVGYTSTYDKVVPITKEEFESQLGEMYNAFYSRFNTFNIKI
jgi:hypothetical protein